MKNNIDLSKSVLKLITELSQAKDKIKELEKWDTLQSIELQQAKEEIKKLREGIKKVKNPYSQEKQYTQWASAENVLDIIIRQLLSNKH